MGRLKDNITSIMPLENKDQRDCDLPNVTKPVSDTVGILELLPYSPRLKLINTHTFPIPTKNVE